MDLYLGCFKLLTGVYIGLDGAGQGSGLHGLSDRVATLGGQLNVSSGTGLGTCVQAVIPCV